MKKIFLRYGSTIDKLEEYMYKIIKIIKSESELTLAFYYLDSNLLIAVTSASTSMP